MRASTRKPSPSAGGGASIATITLTRCSSTPSAEMRVNADGSTRSTWPDSGGPPQPSMVTGAPGTMRTASIDSTSTTTSSAEGSPISTERRPAATGPSLVAEDPQHAPRDRRGDDDVGAVAARRPRGSPAPSAPRRRRSARPSSAAARSAAATRDGQARHARRRRRRWRRQRAGARGVAGRLVVRRAGPRDHARGLRLARAGAARAAPRRRRGCARRGSSGSAVGCAPPPRLPRRRRRRPD